MTSVLALIVGEILLFMNKKVEYTVPWHRDRFMHIEIACLKSTVKLNTLG